MRARPKPAQLSATLVVRKGEATPARAPAPAVPSTPGQGAADTLVAPTPTPLDLTSMTLKLDDERYRRLKSLGMRRPRRSSQDILVAALDAYLEAQGA